MNNKYKKQLFFAALLFGLTACGGGSDEPSDGEKSAETSFLTSDFDKQVYVIKEGGGVLGSALFFNAGGTGIEYLDDEPSTKSEFAWDVNEGKLNINSASYALESEGGNRYYVRKNGVSNLNLYKAKPLSLLSLNGVILDYTGATYTSPEGNDVACNDRTLKITGSTAVVKQICGHGKEDRYFTVSPVAGFKNAIEFTEEEGGSTVIMLLTDGSIDEGKVTQVYSTNGKLDYVELEAIKRVGKEAF